MSETRSSIERATGRDRAAWFGEMDSWGAAGRPYREIADWLTGEHAISDWWAQKLIVEYEQARGLRQPGVRRDGTFQVGASRAVGVAPADVLAAVRDPAVLAQAFPGVALRERTTAGARAVRFDWDGGPMRLVVTVDPAGADKATVSLQLERIPDAERAAAMKEVVRERIEALKRAVEDR